MEAKITHQLALTEHTVSKKNEMAAFHMVYNLHLEYTGMLITLYKFTE